MAREILKVQRFVGRPSSEKLFSQRSRGKASRDQLIAEAVTAHGYSQMQVASFPPLFDNQPNPRSQYMRKFKAPRSSAGSSTDMARQKIARLSRSRWGSEGFLEQVKNELGLRAQHREVLVTDGLYTVREPVPPYGDHFNSKNEALRPITPFRGKQT